MVDRRIGLCHIQGFVEIARQHSLKSAVMRGQTLLTIGGLPGVVARLLPETARAFERMGAGAVLAVVSGPHGHLTAQLRHGALDLVVGRRGDPAMVRGLSFAHLYSERVTFAVRPGHPLLARPDLARLPDWPVIYPTRRSAIRPLVERLLVASGVGEIPNRIESVSGAFGRAYARQTDAVWIISEGVAAMGPADGTLVALPFDTDLTLGPIGLMLRADADPSPDARLFQRALTETVARIGLR